ncbi:MAG: hypothetical protein K2X84_16615 [Beijerinckiaceae bacterium]|nr:hypothetical protein [Beijerinckiaceae bacterium]
MTTETGEYNPSVQRLLDDYADDGDMPNADRWLAETADTLRDALRSYGMKADILATRLTPNAALVHFKGNDNISVDRIEKKRSYLYTTWGLDISAIRPGKGRVSVMVKRDARHVNQTGLLWKRRQLPATAPHYNTSFLLGEREDNGEPIYLNLTAPNGGQPVSGPHTLIAGESGGGKGVLAANLIMDICATNSPTMARVHLIDPKAGVDYDWLARLPHLEGGIVTDPTESHGRYGDLIAEMERRYGMLAEARARDLDAYNRRVESGEVAGDILPRVYVVHDELADWMIDDDYRKEVGEKIARIAAKGRAAGMHLILITQRPDKKSIPGLIKANMANKIALRVSNKVNSNLVIDESGAEELMGAGHMLAIIGGVPGGPQFVQSSYMDPWDAQLIADAIIADTATAAAPKQEGQKVVAIAA